MSAGIPKLQPHALAVDLTRPEGPYDLDAILPSVLDTAAGLIPADAFAVWLLDHARNEWRIVASRGLSEHYRSVVLSGDLPGLPESPIAAEDPASSPLLQIRSELYAREGVRSLLIVPLAIRGERRGSLAFYFRQPRKFSPAEIQLGSSLAGLTSSAVATAELYREQLQAKRHSDFLAEAGVVLASSLDYEETLSTVARLAVPFIADRCGVDIVEHGALKRVAAAHVDMEKGSAVREILRKFPPQLRPDEGAGRVLQTGQSELYSEVTDEMLRRAAVNQEHLGMWRKIGMLSVLLVPLKAHNQVLGILTFVTAESGRTLGESDRRLAEELAARAGLALDKARLFRALQQSEQKFRAVSESAACAIYIHDGARVLYANRAAEQLIGYTLQEFGDTEIWQLVHPEERESVKQRAIAKLHGDPGSERQEIRAIRRDGSTLWLDVTSRVIEYAGRPALLATSFDVTERKIAVEQLERRELEARALMERLLRSEAQLRLIIDSMPGLVAYIDCNETYQLVNRAFEGWFLAPMQSMIGRNICELFGQRNYDRIRPQVQRALSGELVQYEVTNDYKDATRHVFSTYVPDFDEAHAVRGFVLLVMDVTERQKTEEALRRTEKLAATGRLAASIAHEINNPLESVTNLLFLLQSESQLSESGRQYLAMAEGELARVAQIATQTLRFHRQSTRPAPTNVEEILDAVEMLYRRRLLTSGVHFEKRYGNVGPIQALDGEIRQLLANVIGNALDATPSGGSVVVRTRQGVTKAGERGVQITVADTGHGIPRALMNRLFEPFITTKGITGTGLGLWVSRQIVDKHHGTIRVRSRSVGLDPGGSPTGTVFRIFLPDLSQMGRQSAIASSEGPDARI